jgi:hypothetical protein
MRRPLSKVGSAGPLRTKSAVFLGRRARHCVAQQGRRRALRGAAATAKPCAHAQTWGWRAGLKRGSTGAQNLGTVAGAAPGNGYNGAVPGY